MTKSFLSDHFTDKSEVYYLFTDLYRRNYVMVGEKTKQKKSVKIGAY